MLLVTGLLAEASVSLVQITLDGPPGIHNAIRGHLQSFTKALAAIKVLKTYPHITVGVSTTVMPLNLDSLSEVKDILKPLKVDSGASV